jgi:DtxR family Mn-dependent transcriptional regulator
MMPSEGCSEMKKPEQLTAHTDNYLEVIWGIEAREGAVRVTDVADALGFLKGSVSGAMKKLKARGYIDYAPYRPIKLTAKGRRIGQRIVCRNLVLTRFFNDVLKMDPALSRRAAQRIGPVTDEQIVECMHRFLVEFCDGHALPVKARPAKPVRDLEIEYDQADYQFGVSDRIPA